ncbi:membrane hypothetical protein [uncultured Desulfobacterium sp.]|uniref:O-antigen ligase-related domain-containing protein n=1 Tax=uncultured Desulfobacterium sp. TaxID=201089 RepID=A0A445MZV9_9BACT|nr:membrane hypothetical protein [uncultured Desulfobacterium sp.]
MLFIGKISLLEKMRHEALTGLLLLLVIFLNNDAINKIKLAFKNGAWKAYVLFGFVTFLSIPFSVWPGNAFHLFIDFFKLFLFCLMIVGCIRGEKEFNSFVVLFIICMVYVTLGAFQNHLTGTYAFDYATGTYRIESPIKFYRNSNVLAVSILQCLPFIYYRIIHNVIIKKKVENALLLIIMGLMMFIVVLTGSRGGFLVFAGLMVFISYRSQYRKSAMLIMLIVAVGIWILMGQEYQNRYSTISELGQSDKPAHDRILGLQHGFEMLLSRPIIGVGIGCYQHARWHMFNNPLWAHNLPGQLMGELGVSGTIVFIILLWQCYRNTIKARILLADNGFRLSSLYSHAMAIEASLFAQIINGIGQHSLYLYGFYLMNALSVALLRITENKVEVQESSEK